MESSATGDNNGAAAADVPPTTIRPCLTFETITFSDGQTFSFEDDEIVVFVGPNNAGKSAALRELDQLMARSRPGQVITKTTLKKIGDATVLREYLEKTAIKKVSGGQVVYSGMGYGINAQFLSWFDGPDDRHTVSPYFVMLLGTEARLTGSNPAPPIALYDEPPSHPIHLLMADDKLQDRLSRLFRKAFSQDLVVFRAGGSTFPLYVGSKPALEESDDQLSQRYVSSLRSQASPLQSQGDGMRSFATVMLHVLATDNHSVQLLDELEAFLHPPQATIARRVHCSRPLLEFTTFYCHS